MYTLSARWLFGCTAAGIALMLGLTVEFQRIKNGRLFLLALPAESPPSETELIDARDSVNTFWVPALVTIGVATMAFTFGVPRFQPRFHLRNVPRWLWVAFAAACLADFLTTFSFFQQAGVDHELHPGIRLLAYGYGRTVGAAGGKISQAVGLVLLALISAQWGKWLIAVATLLFMAGAVYNSLQP